MSLWSRIANSFRGDRMNREIDEELQSHLDAIERGRDPAEARKSLGSSLRQRENSRDIKLIPWLDSLRADAIFGWRQLRKNKVTSAAAILSLALAIGAGTSAFRLIDALLLRPLPVAGSARLYSLFREGIGFDGKPNSWDGWAYPVFREMRAAARDQAELIAVSDADRMDLSYASDEEMEKADIQYVSGWMFESFGMKPALGRLLTENDDLTPGAHPYAVLSYDYWKRRFGLDSKVIGRTFRLGNAVFEIVGVGSQQFTGTEPGSITDIFLPTMMHRWVTRSDSTWHRILALMKPGVAVEPFRQKLNAISHAFETERAKSFTGMSQTSIDNYLNQTLRMEPAAAGASDMQEDYGRSLAILGSLVGLVLLIACANVANLMTAQAAARAREMALRVSIGAGRWRLVQLVMLESAMLAFFAAVIGAVFAWWSAPMVVGMINPPDHPARLILPADLRVVGFGLLLILGVMILFGIVPALRASNVKPMSALKGGDDPHSRRRLMHSMIAVQVAFCFLVVFVAGLFVATFDRLSHRPIGFSSERILLLDTVAPQGQSPVVWEQVADHLRAVPGVEKVAISGWALLEGGSWNDAIAVDGGKPSEDMAYFLTVSPGWLETMKISMIDGRDFRPTDSYPGVAIVSEAFAKRYFNAADPVGKHFERATDEGARIPNLIVGLVRDAPYRSMREGILPVVFVPIHELDAKGAVIPEHRGTFTVRTAGDNPASMASVLRKEVPRARAGFRVSTVRTQRELIDAQTVRERLLATLALFFAGVALLLAGVGLYGVLHYSVLQRRREIGIRMALGAQAADIARRVTADAFMMVLTGAVAGLALGLASVRYIESLLYGVKATDLATLAIPSLAIVTAALLATLPGVIKAVRIDPVKTLRSE